MKGRKHFPTRGITAFFFLKDRHVIEHKVLGETRLNWNLYATRTPFPVKLMRGVLRRVAAAFGNGVGELAEGGRSFRPREIKGSEFDRESHGVSLPLSNRDDVAPGKDHAKSKEPIRHTKGEAVPFRTTGPGGSVLAFGLNQDLAELLGGESRHRPGFSYLKLRGVEVRERDYVGSDNLAFLFPLSELPTNLSTLKILSLLEHT